MKCQKYSQEYLESLLNIDMSSYKKRYSKYDEKSLHLIAKAGEGSIRDALSIADTAISYGSGKLTYDDVTEILGSSNWELIFSFVSSVLKGNTGEVLSVIDKLSAIVKC